MTVPNQSNYQRSGQIAGRYVVIPLVIIILVIAGTFIVIRNSGKGAAATNYLLLTYTQGLRDLDEGYLDSAIKNFSIVINADSRPAAYGFRAEAYLRKKAYEEAEQDFQRAIQLEPNIADNYCGLAETYIAREQFTKAMDALDQAIPLATATPDTDQSVRHRDATKSAIERRRTEVLELIDHSDSPVSNSSSAD